MYNLLQLLALLVTFLIIITFLKRKWAIVALSVLLSFVFSLQVSSVLIGGSVIDYKYYLHFDIDESLSVAGFFWFETVMIVLSFLLSLVLFLLAGLKWKFHDKLKSKIKLSAIAVCVLLMSFSNGVLFNLYDISSMLFASDESFAASLEQVGFDPDGYNDADEIEAKAGKNIIVISLESYEAGYLSSSLAHLTPNLHKLKRELTYFDMQPTPGSGWTAGSMYTVLTGLPCFFKSQGNDTFQNTTSVKIPGVGHILKQAGYNTTYLMGKKEFAGMADMLETYQFTVKSDTDFDTKYEMSRWGMHDLDLFAEAKKQLRASKKDKKPFALFMSTISTHAPDGIYDKRMEGVVAPQKSDLEFMVASVDHMIGELYTFLQKEKLLSNTTIYIFPDHLLMGSTARVLKEFPEPRGLFMLTSAKEKNLSYRTAESITQIDISRLILDGANVKHNVKFLTEKITKGDKSVFITENKRNILALNESSLKTTTFRKGITIDLEKKNLVLRSGTHTDTLRNIQKKNNALYVLNFDKSMRLTSKALAKDFSEIKTESDNPRIFINFKSDKMFCYLKKGDIIGVAKTGTDQVTFTEDDVNVFLAWNVESQLDATPEYITVNAFQPDHVFLTSTGFGPHLKHTPSEIRVGDTSLPFSRGINVLFYEKGEYGVETFDTHGDSLAAAKLVKRLKGLQDGKGFYALVVHDSGAKKLGSHRKTLQQMGYELLSALNNREAYIAYSVKGSIKEHSHKKTVSIAFPSNNPKSAEKKKDTERFIAHAGGKIGDHRYTNSLEALNQSYKKGFRLFELDIVETSDGVYVAAHDWKTWGNQSKYSKDGKVPTLAEFKQRKILNKYTPLDINDINKWFRDHKDAILITDKVNEPRKFSSRFVDPKRLMMEIFTFDSLKVALSAGIRSAMPSTKVINAIKGDKVKILSDMHVKNVAVSLDAVEKNRKLYQDLKKAGIKTYVYRVNVDEGKDEAYVVSKEFGTVYGLYADEWDFR